ncbi:hypothetical protein VTI74DRAFT_7240 [Chaetomium olivicolor]
MLNHPVGSSWYPMFIYIGAWQKRGIENHIFERCSVGEHALLVEKVSVALESFDLDQNPYLILAIGLLGQQRPNWYERRRRQLQFPELRNIGGTEPSLAVPDRTQQGNCVWLTIVHGQRPDWTSHQRDQEQLQLTALK